jgi:hypothetical protein
VNYDEYRIIKEQLAGKKETEENKITEDIQPDLTDSEEEDEESDKETDALTEALHEKEVHSHDTFLYHVNELSLDEKTVTNEIASYIVGKEKGNVKLREYVKDEFHPENENFYFKAESGDEECASAIEETIVIQEDDASCGEEKNTNEDKEETKNKGGIFDSFRNNLSGKRKRNPKPTEREKATVVAPGENQKFDNEFKYQEEKCFPTLFPMGTSGYASSYIETGLGFSNYCKLRLTGGICITDKDMHEKIKKIETNSCIDYERFRSPLHDVPSVSTRFYKHEKSTTNSIQKSYSLSEIHNR